MPTFQDTLNTPVQYVKGVGPRRSQLLERLGLTTVEDLLYFFPRFHEDRSKVQLIKNVQVGELATLQGKILSCGVQATKTGMSFFQAAVSDRSGLIYATWYNQPYLSRQFKVGMTVTLSGRAVRYAQLQLINPEFEAEDKKDAPSLNLGRVVPVYGLTRDLSQKALRTIIYSALRRYVRQVQDPLTPAIKQKYRLVDRAAALFHIHFPGGSRHLAVSRRRLVFDEFFLLQLALALRKRERGPAAAGIRQNSEAGSIEAFGRSLPFELTQAQKRVMRQIQGDLARQTPMNRLVQGDVGSGKTMVALFAALVSMQNGYQTAVMVPTEILAQQHYLNFSRFLYPFKGRVALLLQRLKPQDLRETRRKIEAGEIDVIIGTHKLIQEGVVFARLGLVVVDEQHKFGVAQRGLLKAKGASPDCLIMTATPIPRTLALTLYGDLEISVLDESPPGRGSVTTIWVDPGRRDEIYTLVREEVERGHHAYIVYPAIEGNKGGLENTQDGFKKMQAFFSQDQIGRVHGKMKAQECKEVLKAFREGRIRVLVSTTVVEVGVDMPQATVMVIENAERFGLAQLHQLRGRVGRGSADSYCILIGQSKGVAEERLNALVETTDGFQIAERDLAIRGPGEFFGTRQHGLPNLRIGNITTDLAAMEEARGAALELIGSDPGLGRSEHQLLRALLQRHYGVGQTTNRVTAQEVS